MTHDADRVPDQLSVVEKLVYMPIIVFVKTSILLQYVTIFVVHRRNLFHFGLHVLIWTNSIFYVVMAFVYLFEVSTTSKTCLNTIGRLNSH